MDNKGETSYVWAQTYRKYDPLLFNADIAALDCGSVYLSDNPEQALDRFYNLIFSVVDYHAPFKYIKCKGERPAWLTNEFLSLVDDRVYCQRRYNKCPTAENLIARDLARARVNEMKIELKRSYVADTLADCQGDSRATWRELKKLWPTKNKGNNIPCLNGEDDSSKIPNILNEHFANIRETLANKLPSPHKLT